MKAELQQNVVEVGLRKATPSGEMKRRKKAKGIDPCNFVMSREREMTAGQVPVLSL